MSLFLSSSGRSVVAHAPAGRLQVVLGDPVGPEDGIGAAMSEFVESARSAGSSVAVYQASAGALEALRGAGFQRIFRIGQEAIVDLGSFGLRGSRRANLRHTVTRFHRDGASVEWFPGGLDDASEARLGSEIAAIDATWRRGAGPELGFTIGSFHPSELAATPISVAVDEAGRARAFVTFKATGADRGYVVDLMRRLPSAAPGAIEACIAEAATGMRRLGARRLSLGLAPISGLARAGGPIEERAIRLAADVVRRWYDVDGLAFFKAKFDPAWEPRYIAAFHRRDAFAVSLALVRLHLGRGGTIRGIRRSVRATLRRETPVDGSPG